MITLYSADITGNPGNCSYPHRHDVVDADSLKAAVCHDYVCAEYKNHYRNNDNFIEYFGICLHDYLYIWFDQNLLYLHTNIRNLQRIRRTRYYIYN